MTNPKPGDDANGWALTRDRDRDFWAVRGDDTKLAGNSDTLWVFESSSEYEIYAPHTPITLSDLPEALRSTL